MSKRHIVNVDSMLKSALKQRWESDNRSAQYKSSLNFKDYQEIAFLELQDMAKVKWTILREICVR